MGSQSRAGAIFCLRRRSLKNKLRATPCCGFTSSNTKEPFCQTFSKTTSPPPEESEPCQTDPELIYNETGPLHLVLYNSVTVRSLPSPPDGDLTVEYQIQRRLIRLQQEYGPVRFSYNPSFSACFFSRNSIFSLTANQSEQCFGFSEANGP